MKVNESAEVLSAKTGGRNHLFDLMRILFAICVLLSHAPEMADGNRSRELLSRFTHGGISFGEFGLFGFFLLSGYLIVHSWMHDPELINYLRKRLLRIIPGYLVSALLSTFAVGLLAPAVPHFFHGLDRGYVKTILQLGSPTTPPVLPGATYALVNGALYTIPYELRCYLIVALCGLLGILRKKALWLLITLPLVTVLFLPAPGSELWSWRLFPYIGNPSNTFSLTAVFCVGASFFLFREQIRFRPLYGMLAGAIFFAVNALYPAADRAVMVLCGGYLLFYLGSSQHSWLNWMKHMPDISYGIYLYGWPVEALLIFFHLGSPWTVFLYSTVLCCALGWLSWELVERPMLKLKRHATAPLPPA